MNILTIETGWKMRPVHQYYHGHVDSVNRSQVIPINYHYIKSGKVWLEEGRGELKGLLAWYSIVFNEKFSRFIFKRNRWNINVKWSFLFFTSYIFFQHSYSWDLHVPSIYSYNTGRFDESTDMCLILNNLLTHPS